MHAEDIAETLVAGARQVRREAQFELAENEVGGWHQVFWKSDQGKLRLKRDHIMLDIFLTTMVVGGFIREDENSMHPVYRRIVEEDELIEVLNPKVFFRANRQFIVTFQSIAEIHPYFKGRIKLQLNPVSAEEVVISSDRTPEFKKWIDQ